MSETTPETSALRERLAEALRTCRVDDGAPIRLIKEPDVYHVSHMLLPVVAQEVAAAEQRGADRVATAVEALADEWESWAKARSTTRIDAFRDAAEALRAAVAESAPKEAA